MPGELCNVTGRRFESGLRISENYGVSGSEGSVWTREGSRGCDED